MRTFGGLINLLCLFAICCCLQEPRMGSPAWFCWLRPDGNAPFIESRHRGLQKNKGPGPLLWSHSGWEIRFYISSSSHVLQNRFYNLYLYLKVTGWNVQVHHFISTHADDCGEKWGHLVTIRKMFLLSWAIVSYLNCASFFFLAE